MQAHNSGVGGVKAGGSAYGEPRQDSQVPFHIEPKLPPPHASFTACWLRVGRLG